MVSNVQFDEGNPAYSFFCSSSKDTTPNSLSLPHAALPSALFLPHPISSQSPPSLPLQPMPSNPPQAYSPEVSAACCLTAALSRLKALSAGPSRPFAPMPEDQRRAAVLRKADSANGARVAVRRPSIVSCVVVGVESCGCEASAGSSASTAVGVGRSRGCCASEQAGGVPERLILMAASCCDESFAGRGDACTV
jgi:hypothetical protein